MRPTLWVCAACGREGDSKEALFAKDTSCGTWAIKVYADAVTRTPEGRIIEAIAVEDAEVG